MPEEKNGSSATIVILVGDMYDPHWWCPGAARYLAVSDQG